MGLWNKRQAPTSRIEDKRAIREANAIYRKWPKNSGDSIYYLEESFKNGSWLENSELVADIRRCPTFMTKVFNRFPDSYASSEMHYYNPYIVTILHEVSTDKDGSKYAERVIEFIKNTPQLNILDAYPKKHVMASILYDEAVTENLSLWSEHNNQRHDDSLYTWNKFVELFRSDYAHDPYFEKESKLHIQDIIADARNNRLQLPHIDAIRVATAEEGKEDILSADAQDIISYLFHHQCSRIVREVAQSLAQHEIGSKEFYNK